MQELVGTITTTVKVNQDTTLRGTIQATVSIAGPGIVFVNEGKVQGTASVASGSRMVIVGAQEGTPHVEQEAEVVVEPGGKLAGTLHNDGIVIVRGVFGGRRSGTGELCFEGSGYEKQPSEVRGNVSVYNW